MHQIPTHMLVTLFYSKEDLEDLSPVDWGVLFWRIYQNKQRSVHADRNIVLLSECCFPSLDQSAQCRLLLLYYWLTCPPCYYSTGAASFRYGLVPFCHIPHLGKKQHGRLGEQLQAWEPNRWNGMNEIPYIKFLVLAVVSFSCFDIPMFLSDSTEKLTLLLQLEMTSVWYPGSDLGRHQQKNGGSNIGLEKKEWI